jgi:hypothetical protein
MDRVAEGTDKVLRQDGRGFNLPPGQVEVPDPLRGFLVAVAAGQVVVEVLAAGAHAADGEGEPGPDGRRCG